MKPLIFLTFLTFFCILLPSCLDDDERVIGSISFTADADCDIRLFDSNGRQIARGNYELEKAPFVVSLKHSGVYVVHAESEGKPTKKDPVTFVVSMEYYIEF